MFKISSTKSDPKKHEIPGSVAHYYLEIAFIRVQRGVGYVTQADAQTHHHRVMARRILPRVGGPRYNPGGSLQPFRLRLLLVALLLRRSLSLLEQVATHLLQQMCLNFLHV